MNIVGCGSFTRTYVIEFINPSQSMHKSASYHCHSLDHPHPINQPPAYKQWQINGNSTTMSVCRQYQTKQARASRIFVDWRYHPKLSKSSFFGLLSNCHFERNIIYFGVVFTFYTAYLRLTMKIRFKM